MNRRNFLCCGLGAAAALSLAGRAAAISPRVLPAALFGAVGDGKTDDGPAVLRLLDAALAIESPVTIQFAPHKTYYLATGRERYAFLIEGAKGMTLDGGGSIFVIDSQLRFLSLTRSRDVAVRNFKVEYSPLPFAEGLIIAKNQADGWVDVKIDSRSALPPLGGPTHEDGEQSYFGLLWHEGPYSRPSERYFVRDNFDVLDVREANPGSLAERIVRVVTTPNSPLIADLKVGVWQLSVPVRGVAHRYGPGESCKLAGNHNLTVEDLDIWSAPWFAIGVSRNTGRAVFRRTHVRPRPSSGRLASSARDGFHVSGNRASLLFDGCILQGMGDDAFNISTLASGVRKVDSPTRLEIQPNFPLALADFAAGDTVAAYHETRGVLLGRAKVAKATVIEPGSASPPRASVSQVDLQTPVPGIEAGETIVWDDTSANPDTTLTNCRIDTSCRFRSPVTIVDSRFNALAWFTGDAIEAPIPHNIVVRSTVFRLGQGNPSRVVVIDGPIFAGHGPTEPVIFHVIFDNCTVYGDFALCDSADIRLNTNNFADPARKIIMRNICDVKLESNTYGSKPLADVKEIETGSAKDAAEIGFEG